MDEDQPTNDEMRNVKQGTWKKSKMNLDKKRDTCNFKRTQPEQMSNFFIFKILRYKRMSCIDNGLEVH